MKIVTRASVLVLAVVPTRPVHEAQPDLAGQGGKGGMAGCWEGELQSGSRSGVIEANGA